MYISTKIENKENYQYPYKNSSWLKEIYYKVRNVYMISFQRQSIKSRLKKSYIKCYICPQMFLKKKAMKSYVRRLYKIP